MNMDFMTFQILLILFLVFAMSRVYLRYKSKKLGWFGLLFWGGLFGVGLIMIIFPGVTVLLAHRLGIGRGVDFIVYISIAVLFYLMYRLYSMLSDISDQITEIVRELALRNKSDSNNKK
jgi:hypothetical protein